jgi:alkanesulfonate monooxygenase SsuD/methylene tetrahydromethanopterin reductase-like flavin-dependent oxidoreductase (luciferase family)
MNTDVHQTPTLESVEIGLVASPHPVTRITVGAAVEAEAEGCMSLWYPDALAAADVCMPQPGSAGLRGSAAAIADPFVTASAALLATRRCRVAVLGADITRCAPERIATAAISMAGLAPGRVVLALAAPDEPAAIRLGIEPDHVIAWLESVVEIIDALARPGGSLAENGVSPDFARADSVFASDRTPEVVVVGALDAVARLSARLGLGWLSCSIGGVDAYRAHLQARSDETAGVGAAAAGDSMTGVHVVASIHDDAGVAARALEDPRLQQAALMRAARYTAGANGEDRWRWATSPADAAVRVLHGTPSTVVDQVVPYVDAGARRVVIENLLPLADFEEVETAARATWATIKHARLALRVPTLAAVPAMAGEGRQI